VVKLEVSIKSTTRVNQQQKQKQWVMDL